MKIKTNAKKLSGKGLDTVCSWVGLNRLMFEPDWVLRVRLANVIRKLGSTTICIDVQNKIREAR